MRLRSVLLILLLIIAFSTINMIMVSEATTIITLKVDPAKVPGRVGKNISFDITISGVNASVLDLWAWEMKVNWTDTDFNFVSAVEGPFLKQSGPTFWVAPILSSGGGNETVLLSCTRTGAGTGSLGSGILATLTFYVVGGPTGSIFDLFAIKLRNSLLDPIAPPKYDVSVIDTDGQFARARDWDIEPQFGVVDIYDLGVVAVNFGTNVNRPTKIATQWAADALGGWLNPEAVGASDDIRAASNTQNQAEKWMYFRFNTTSWTGVTKVEVGLEWRVGSSTRDIKIEVSNDNGTTWSPTSYTRTIANLSDTMTWTDVTSAYSWTKAMVASIAVRLTCLGTGAIAMQIDYLVVRVTPTPALGGTDCFDPDADVTGDRKVNIDDLVKVATNYGPYQL